MNFFKNLFNKSTKPLKNGEPAPDFDLESQSGKRVRLSEYKGKKAVVLYFYPKDNTPICTAESVAFRDCLAQFQEAGAEILGISSDSVPSHVQFAGKYKLPFPLLSDADGTVRKMYRVPHTMGFIPGRTTFVIDEEGLVRFQYTSQFNYDSHVSLALKTLKDLRKQPV